MSKYLNQKHRFANIQLIAIYILVILLAVCVTSMSQRVKYKKQIEEINATHEAELSSLRSTLQKEYETKLTELEQYYEYGGDVSQIEREAEYIAKVIYGTAISHTDADKRAVVWCILNRVEHHAHPDTIQGVCEQPKQWMGYSDNNPVLTDIYDLALAELKIWYSGGHRPMGKEYIYLSWSSSEILLRDTFEEGKNTRYWRMR
jgi:hypothetical protein